MEKTARQSSSTVNSQRNASQFARLLIAEQALSSLLALALLCAAYPQRLVAQDAQDQQSQTQAPPDAPYMQQSPEQLEQLVAPIALYPDSLVAQILAASTFPEQVVEADRWVQSHPDLKGDALAQAVDQEPWDPSVKALTAFPSVLGNMDKNVSWTSSLGDTYFNQEQAVMDAIQVMRRRAQQAGNLNSTSQQTVTTADSDIQIEAVDPEVVYVPAYDPWIVYGGPIVAWPGWYPYPGIWYDGPTLFFGAGFGIGFFGGYGWGWHHWGFDWHHHYAVFDHARYQSPSRTFYNRDAFYRGEGARGAYDRAGKAQPFAGDRGAARGYAEPRGQSGVRSDAFSGFGRGGEERSFSSRGSASFGGGGGFHGGGGGFHGGGGRH
jgi:uncharacterized membrane protein YgcG